MKHIRTNTDYHYISTAWLDVLGYWETQVFEKTAYDQIDWAGVSSKRTDNPDKAIVHHCDAIKVVVEWERKVGK